ncbi:hypothetical protein LCGC14_2684760, partial [marine sediment metagenome]
HDPPFNEYEDFARMIWQEATKQRDAQYGSMAEHTELSIREDAIIGERGRIVERLSIAADNEFDELADICSEVIDIIKSMD